MLIAPVVLSTKVSLAVPGTEGGASRVTFTVGAGTHGSGWTARLVVGEGGRAVDLGVADVMENGIVGALDKVVPEKTVTLTVALVVGTVDDLIEVLVTVVAKAVVSGLVADVIDVEASRVGNGFKVTAGLMPGNTRICFKKDPDVEHK